MSWCSVFACSGTKPEGGIYQHYINLKDRNFRLQWMQKCGREDKVSEYGHIYEHHFSPEQYSRDLQSEFLGVRSKKRRFRKSTAVPDLNLSDVCIKGKVIFFYIVIHLKRIWITR